MISKKDEIEKEKDRIRIALTINGYPECVTNDLATTAQAILEEEVEGTPPLERDWDTDAHPQPAEPSIVPKPQKWIICIEIPYVKRFSNKYRRIL